jgi:outer membrane murein-binding lipoprotein Lpp
MNKLLVAIVTSSFLFTTGSVLAADTAKKEDLTKEQRIDMRSRADQLTQARAQTSTPVKANASRTPKANTHHVRKAKKVSRHGVTKAHPKA